MPDLWMDVDTALAEVPVNIFPLLDDTDFKSIEGAVAYNAAGMALRWHFVTTAGAYTVTSVTPTTGGNYDWTDQGDSGIYTIEITASGGASINNDTEGFGWFTGVATGVLPWRGPTIGFRRAALNDLLIDGSTASTNLEDFFDGTGYVGGTAKFGVDVVNWKGSAAPAMTGDAYARLGAPAGASVSADIAAIEAQTDDIGAAGAGLTALPWNANWDAEVQSEAQDAITASALATAAALATVDDFLDTEVAAILAAVDTEVAAIKTKTDFLPSATAGAAGGVFIAGSNAATSVTTALTANITGNLSGSVGSVTGAVGSVTGDTKQTADVATLITTVGVAGAGLTALATQASVTTIDDFLDTEVAAILADTNELQTDWVNGGRLDLILDIIAADTTTDIPALINDLPTNAELATALGTADDAVLAELAKVPKSDSNVTWNATALASINAAMDTALDTPIPGSPTADSINERVATMDTSVALMRLLIATGTVVDDNDPDPTATAFETNLAEASNDHYNGAFLVFTSGALLGQSRKIAGYVGATKVITTSAFTEAPAGGDTFAILGRSE